MARVGFFSAGRTMTLGFAAQNVLMLVRAMIVARLLGPEFFGISVTFLLVVSTFAMISDLGLEKWIIQSREDELESSLPTLASVLLLRGLVLGGTILLLAGWIAQQFGNPDLVWFYACAGIVPIIEGFRHLDQVVQQRQMNFVPKLKMELGGLIPGVLLTIALAYETRSYVAIAAGSIAVSVISVALSHVLARSRYRLGFERGAVVAILRFGWPLLANGMVMLVSTQGDRILIGAMAGMSDLAGYAAVGMLTTGVSMLFSRLSGGLLLPLLSEARDRPQLYEERCRTTAAAILLIVSTTLIPLACIGAPLVRLLYGPGYEIAPLLAAFLSLLAASTVIRSWCVVISLSVARTMDILTSNVLRSIGFAAAFFALKAGYGLVGVAACMAAGDVAATYFFLWRIGRRVAGATRATVILGVALSGYSVLLIALTAAFDPSIGLVLAGFLGAAASVPGALAAMVVSPDLRRRIAGLISAAIGKTRGSLQ